VLVRYGEKFFNFFKMRKKKLAYFVEKIQRIEIKNPPLLLVKQERGLIILDSRPRLHGGDIPSRE